jgi:5-oxopent-3-ene-1,2,5-tricarboxylate decarboxylase / 2-hydroxyhepta-2,4-diene-1,7-dioate isomerase
MRLTASVLLFLLWAGVGLAQKAPLELNPVERRMPEYIVERLSPQDRVLFDKLMRVGLESAWSLVTAEGYPQNFINELTPLKASMRMVGRARTMRYLPNRKDVREKLYSAGPQLNYKSAEEAQPGDVLVFDAGGETRAGVSGGVTTVRFLVRGGAGLVIDGAMRDVPELEAMPIQTYMRRGHASSVAPIMMSVDYQVPVRIGTVTVIPGDILVGESTGILVIPAAIAEKIADKALEHDEEEAFQRQLLLHGESIYGVYPMNPATRKRFEEYRKQKKN